MVWPRFPSPAPPSPSSGRGNPASSSTALAEHLPAWSCHGFAGRTDARPVRWVPGAGYRRAPLIRFMWFWCRLVGGLLFGLGRLYRAPRGTEVTDRSQRRTAPHVDARQSYCRGQTLWSSGVGLVGLSRHATRQRLASKIGSAFRLRRSDARWSAAALRRAAWRLPAAPLRLRTNHGAIACRCAGRDGLAGLPTACVRPGVGSAVNVVSQVARTTLRLPGPGIGRGGLRIC